MNRARASTPRRASLRERALITLAPSSSKARAIRVNGASSAMRIRRPLSEASLRSLLRSHAWSCGSRKAHTGTASQTREVPIRKRATQGLVAFGGARRLAPHRGLAIASRNRPVHEGAEGAQPERGKAAAGCLSWKRRRSP